MADKISGSHNENNEEDFEYPKHVYMSPAEKIKDLGMSGSEVNDINETKNLNSNDYFNARYQGATHNEVMDASSWDRGSVKPVPVEEMVYNPVKKVHIKSTYMWDPHVSNYANARGNGASHEEANEVHSKGLNLSDYSMGRKRGLSHVDAMDSIRPTFNSVGETVSVEPTTDEYAEARSLDIDPDTFDKATYKRVRNAGAPHKNVIDASNRGIPVEDYEAALKNNGGNHLKAVDEALRYQDDYKENMSNNSTIVAHNTEQMSNNKKLIDDNSEAFNGLVSELFGHHMSLKAKPSFDNGGDGYVDAPWRRRANEWVMNECSKLDPSLKPHVGKSIHDPEAILSPDDYSQKVNHLLTKNQYGHMFANTLKDYVSQRRKQNALINIGESHFIPSGYKHELYEEEN